MWKVKNWLLIKRKFVSTNLSNLTNRHEVTVFTSAAEVMIEKISFMIAISMVVEQLILAVWPSGAINKCSGEVEGLVSKYLPRPSINQSNRKVAHPSNNGYAVFSRKPCVFTRSQHISLISTIVIALSNPHIIQFVQETPSKYSAPSYIILSLCTHHEKNKSASGLKLVQVEQTHQCGCACARTC